MLTSAIEEVRRFQDHMRVSFEGVWIENELPPYLSQALHALDLLKNVSEVALDYYKNGTNNVRDLRFHLEAEEGSERLRALVMGKLVDYLDGCADTLFVMFGTAITYDLPLDEVYKEICRSNMSKAPRSAVSDCPRLSDKGPNYTPPDIQSILEWWEAERGIKKLIEDNAKPS